MFWAMVMLGSCRRDHVRASWISKNSGRLRESIINKNVSELIFSSTVTEKLSPDSIEFDLPIKAQVTMEVVETAFGCMFFSTQKVVCHVNVIL